MPLITRKRTRGNREKQPHSIPDQASTGCLGPVLRGQGRGRARLARPGRTAVTKDRIDKLVDDVRRMRQ